MIALNSDTLPQAQTDAIFAAAGVKPRVALRTSSSQVACLLAAEGLGYAVADPIAAHGLGARVAAHRIRPAFMLTYGVLTPQGQPASPAARLFAAEMRGALKALAGHAPGASDPTTSASEASAGPGQPPSRAAAGDGMRVTGIEVRTPARPMPGGQRNARRTPTEKAFPFRFVTAEDGTVGLGEGWTSHASARALAATIEDDVAPSRSAARSARCWRARR